MNPYFRSCDSAALLAEHRVRLISPTFASTTLETPSLPAEMYAAFETAGRVVLDVGGDDAGATALGRFAEDVSALDYDLLYVVNRYRNLTSTPQEAASLLAEIERASHLHATGVVNNSHLQSETTVATVLQSVPYAEETAALLGIAESTVRTRLFKARGSLRGTLFALAEEENGEEDKRTKEKYLWRLTINMMKH